MNTTVSRFGLGPRIWAFLFFLIALWSAIHPRDRFTWWLEVTPAFVAAAVLALTRHRLRFSGLVYVLILLHCAVLFVGGKYTYAEVPLFDWIREVFHQGRNNYDKVGHFAQGFVPALVTRELLLRLGVVQKKAWVNFLAVCVALAISAVYELIEWGTAVATGDSAEAFLGTQGYVWDTQSDMGVAFLGALIAVLLFSRWQDRSLSRI